MVRLIGRHSRIGRWLPALCVIAVACVWSASAWAAESGINENEHAVMEASCTSVTITYRNFPDAPGNAVTQTITIHGAKYSKSVVTFDGPSGTSTMSIVVPPGPGVVDDHATWATNGVKGHFDLAVPLECPPAPDFSIIKLQKIAGTEDPYTTAPIKAKVGQKIDYEIVVHNTGNVPLVFSEFLDTHCGSLTGGPGSNTVAKGATTIYHCNHVLTEAGTYTNAATVSAKASSGTGETVTHTSNTVVAEVLPPPKPSFQIHKLQKIDGSNAEFTASPLLAASGQTVDYEIILTNTGNTPLTFSGFVDEGCEAPGSAPEVEVAAGESYVYYFCSHLLTEPPPYTNVAQITGTPPPDEGSPITHESNPVQVIANSGEGGTEEGEHAVVNATCSYISVTYRNFPNLPGNTVTQTITIHGVKVSKTKFTFDGPTGTDTVYIVVPPGTGVADAHAIWETNGIRGQFDIGVSLECPARPGLEVTKLQQIEGSNTGFTSSTISGEVGQTVDYEIVVHNSGNVPLKLSFADEGCGPATGGPSTGKLAIRSTTTYFCSHVLTDSGSYENTASVVASRTSGPPDPVTHFSNTVTVEVT
jgi:uncharacterized repeat protein (TIGR01451 family)